MQADPICHTVTNIPVTSNSAPAILNEVYSGVYLASQSAFAVTDANVRNSTLPLSFLGCIFSLICSSCEILQYQYGLMTTSGAWTKKTSYTPPTLIRGLADGEPSFVCFLLHETKFVLVCFFSCLRFVWLPLFVLFFFLVELRTHCRHTAVISQAARSCAELQCAECARLAVG